MSEAECQMAQATNSIEVYLEIGRTRTFAVALDWPGWCRTGRDEAAALRALCDYGPRYARALRTMRLSFHAPPEVSDLVIVERLTGNATTNFGAPGLALSRDSRPIDPTELQHLQTVLKACWRTFDTAVQALRGVGKSHSPGTFINYFLTEIAVIITALVMLRSQVFSQATAYAGILGFGLMIGFEICSAFVPTLFSVATLLSMIGGILSMVWYILLAHKFFQLGRGLVA